jgi:hypothetical protein
MLRTKRLASRKMNRQRAGQKNEIAGVGAIPLATGV